MNVLPPHIKDMIQKLIYENIPVYRFKAYLGKDGKTETAWDKDYVIMKRQAVETITKKYLDELFLNAETAADVGANSEKQWHLEDLLLASVKDVILSLNAHVTKNSFTEKKTEFSVEFNGKTFADEDGDLYKIATAENFKLEELKRIYAAPKFEKIEKTQKIVKEKSIDVDAAYLAKFMNQGKE
ncbi:MAG: hypothetical protein LBJ73_01790 [Rickettsiales bacterium]|jgi:hypothetical protein|nr:hypothetical protein [Rickettsiales bacterium]